MRSVLKCAAAAACLCILSAFRVSAAETVIMRHGSENMLTLDKGTAQYIKNENSLAACLVDANDNIYVSMDLFSEAAGIGTDNNNSSYYAYSSKNSRLVFCAKGSRLTFPVGRSFSYKNGGRESEYIIHDVDGELYVPLELIAVRMGAHMSVGDDGYILYAADKENAKTIVDKNNNILPQIMLRYGTDNFANSHNPTNIYMNSDGELAKVSGASCVVRVCDTVYYVADGKLYTYKEADKETKKQLILKNTDGTDVSGYVLNILAVENTLFGIDAGKSQSSTGRLFRCNADGTGFEYITDFDVTNLQYREDMIAEKRIRTIFFLDCLPDRTMYMYNIDEREYYKMQIMNAEAENLIKGSTKVLAASRGIALVDYTVNSMTLIKLPDTPARCEWIKIWDLSDIVKISRPDEKKKFTSITALNLDHETDTIYFADNISSEKALIYSVKFPECKVQLASSVQYYVKRLSLFGDKDGSKVLIAEGDKKNTEIKIK